MPKTWSSKDEKQYQEVLKSMMEQDKKQDEAEEIAARTVNKQRRKEGRTPDKATRGTGNPNTPLESRTRRELYNRAKQLNIRGRSRMSKSELISAIRSR